VNVDLRYIVLIMIKGIFNTYNPAGTFLLSLSNYFITILLSMVMLLILLLWFHHMDTILVVLLVFILTL